MTNQQGAPEALRLAAEVLDWMPTSDTQRALWDRHQEALAVVNAALVEAQQPAPSAAAAVVVYEQKENEMQVWFRPARMHGHPERTPIKATITKDRGNGIVDLTYDDGEFSGNARAVPNALRLPRNVREQVAVWWDVGFEMDFQTAVDNSLKKKKDDPPPQPSPTPQADSAQGEPLQAFDSPRAQALMRAWEEGWAACRDAEYVGEEAQNDAFNSSHTLTLCIAEDQQLPAPQADSQPAPVVDRARIREIFMAHGFTVKEGQTDLKQYVYDAADALLRAASAPADSVTAPAGGVVQSEREKNIAELLDLLEKGKGYPGEYFNHNGEYECYDCRGTHENNAEIEHEPGCSHNTAIANAIRKGELLALIRAATPPAQAADSVLEDAARYDWLFGPRTAAQAVSVPDTVFKPLPQDDVLSQLQGFYMSKSQVNALVDAARKQGGA